MNESLAPQYFEELQRYGTLADLLNQHFEKSNSSLVAHTKMGTCVAYLENKSRRMQIICLTDIFIIDYWCKGVAYCECYYQYSDFSEVVSSSIDFIEKNSSIAAMAKAHVNFVPTESALAHEKGELVDFTWNYLLSTDIPALRALMPLISHDILYFSKTTGYPYKCDLPGIEVLHEAYAVHKIQGNVAIQVFKASASEAIADVAKLIPLDYGPAIDGTAEDL